VEQQNQHQSEQGVVAGGEGVVRVLITFFSAFLGLITMLSVSFGIAALAQIYYNAQRTAEAAAEGGENLNLDLLVIFVLFAAITASIPLGIWVYRWAAKRIPKVIYGH
jgi:hypothetical protein